tara:strand:+ start:2294 stop:2440 length:147 start_codon:yes stop_codon:yes gene_type:complete
MTPPLKKTKRESNPTSETKVEMSPVLSADTLQIMKDLDDLDSFNPVLF